MAMILSLAAVACGLGGLVCTILILVHAFQNSVAKGFLCLCVPCFILYYMFAEFQHPQKGMIIAGALLGNGLSTALRMMAQQM